MSDETLLDGGPGADIVNKPAAAETREDAAPAVVDAGIPTEGRPLIHLLPGYIHCSDKPEVISTLLGSCVAVCLWDPVAKAGGITHYLLPECGADQNPLARFGNVAISLLVEKLIVRGVKLDRLNAKIFGGASLMPLAANPLDHVGARNVDIARRLIKDLGVPVVGENTGGTRGRRLLFFTDNGRALLRFI